MNIQICDFSQKTTTPVLHFHVAALGGFSGAAALSDGAVFSVHCGPTLLALPTQGSGAGQQCVCLTSSPARAASLIGSACSSKALGVLSPNLNY